MKLDKILGWVEELLDCGRFDDVSNNGLQIARTGDDIAKVAFAVDGSVKSVEAAAEAGAQLLIVHHGVSWGGGIRRLVGGEYNVVKAAMEANLALAGYHLPLDANRLVGNNWELARHFGLKNVKPAFSYHGNVIGVVGRLSPSSRSTLAQFLDSRPTSRPSPDLTTLAQLPSNALIGICSGGAGEFAAEAKRLGCDLYVTGEMNWGDAIAAENVGMPMVCAGHYETETFGVKALMRVMKKALKIPTVFVSILLGLIVSRGDVFAGDLACEDVYAAEESEDLSCPYVGLAGSLVLPQGGSRLPHLGGAALRGGYYFNGWFALEGEAAWMEDRAGLAARGIVHWKGWNEWDMLFGFSRWDPFFTLGVHGWLPDGQVGPAAGVGCLYYLDDNWALRFGGEATLGLDGNVEMVYSLEAGVQYCW